MKKFKLTLLVLVLGVILSFSAFAQTCSGSFGNNLSWSLNISTGVMTISGSGDMPDFGSSSESPWNLYNSYVKSVVVSDGVTSVGNWAFLGCEDLSTVSLSSTVTSIGAHAFDSCKNLTDISGNNSVSHIGEGAFYGCNKLETIGLGNISEIHYGTFNGCSALTSIEIPSTVKSIDSSAFAGSGLTSITIPASVKTIGEGAFYNCSNLFEITIEGTLSNIGSYAFSGTAFYNNESNWQNDVLYIGNHLIAAKASVSGSYDVKDQTACIAAGAFKNCKNLVSVTLPANITNIYDNTFSGCTSLTSVEIPETVTSIDSSAFAGCESLESINIPASVTTIGAGAFYGCDSLEEIVVDENNSYYASDDYGTLFNNSKTNLIQYPAGNANTSYTIPSTVTSIDEAAFVNAKNLQQITSDSQSFTDIDGVLFNSSKTTLVRYPAGNTSTSYTIPSTVTKIESGAFAGCPNLKTIALATSVSEISPDAFYNCKNLLRITYNGTKAKFFEIDGYDEIPEGTIVTFSGMTNTISIDSVTKSGTVSTIIVDTSKLAYGATLVVAYYNGNQFVGLERVTSRSDTTVIKSKLSATNACVMTFDSLRNLVPLNQKVEI